MEGAAGLGVEGAEVWATVGVPVALWRDGGADGGAEDGGFGGQRFAAARRLRQLQSERRRLLPPVAPPQPTLRVMALLRRALGLLPPAAAAQTALALLAVPQGSTRLSIECSRTVASLLCDKRCALSPEHVAEIADRALQAQPSAADAEPAVAFCQTVCDAQARCAASAPEASIALVPRTLAAVSDMLGSDRARVRAAAGRALRRTRPPRCSRTAWRSAPPSRTKRARRSSPLRRLRARKSPIVRRGPSAGEAAFGSPRP